MLGFGLGEVLLMLALGSPLAGTSMAAANPLFGLASSAFLRGPGLTTSAGLALFMVRGSTPAMPPQPAATVPPQP